MKIQLLILKRKKSISGYFINYKRQKENIIFAKNGSIKKEGANYLFSLNNGFKLTIFRKW